MDTEVAVLATIAGPLDDLLQLLPWLSTCPMGSYVAEDTAEWADGPEWLLQCTWGKSNGVAHAHVATEQLPAVHLLLLLSL